MTYKPKIGLEIHIKLNTKSKLLSNSSNTYSIKKNKNASIIDLGYPGTLPILNKKAILLAIKFGFAVNADIRKTSIFERKHYFYPDLPKGYQVTQNKLPFLTQGYVNIISNGNIKQINLIKSHLEEDAGRSIHNKHDNITTLDFNRAGFPLLEIVSTPTLNSSEEAVHFFKAIHTLISHLCISECNMEEGVVRCDANISIKKINEIKLGTKTEIKNLNSFKLLKNALDSEINRQIECKEKNKLIEQKTLLYNSIGNKASFIRKKETHAEYRYFPDPDLLPLKLECKSIKSVYQILDEFPHRKYNKFLKKYTLSHKQIKTLTQDKCLATFFEKTINNQKKHILQITTANWLLNDLTGYINRYSFKIKNSPILPINLNKVIQLIYKNNISIKSGKILLKKMFITKHKPLLIIDKYKLQLILNKILIINVIHNIVNQYLTKFYQYKSEYKKIFIFFCGETIKKNNGNLNHIIIKNLLKNILNNYLRIKKNL